MDIVGKIIGGILVLVGVGWWMGCYSYSKRGAPPTRNTVIHTFIIITTGAFLLLGGKLWVLGIAILCAIVGFPLMFAPMLLYILFATYEIILALLLSKTYGWGILGSIAIGVGVTVGLILLMHLTILLSSAGRIKKYIKLLGTENSDDAFFKLIDIGEAAIVPLMPILKRPRNIADARLRGNAMAVLTGIGEPAVKYLIELLEYDIRFSAASSLGEIGNKDGVDAAIKAMFKALNSDDSFDRELAVRSLGNIAKHLTDTALKQSIGETLINASDDEDSGVRRAIAMDLINTHAEQAIPTLEKLKMDDDEMVRDAAQHAIKIMRSRLLQE